MSHIITLENVHMVVVLTGMVSKWSWGRKKILKWLCGRNSLVLLCTYQLISFSWVKFIPGGQKTLQKTLLRSHFEISEGTSLSRKPEHKSLPVHIIHPT